MGDPQQLSSVDLLATHETVARFRWPPRNANDALARELKALPEAKADPYVTSVARAVCALGERDTTAAIGLLGNALKLRRNDLLATYRNDIAVLYAERRAKQGENRIRSL